ncbi:PrpF domain-containing protein [Rosenbergiella collisarenosi]|uniref:PrpF domain-containing protein n=1 Tax=Rosenbergiella collisarenosi TaxID=1544695 RepID=UPI001F4F2FF9|nr:PrpF domain-containing protein [Rosenbergiella collisarenosi]
MKNINLYYVRGGTSSGVVIQKKDLPKDKSSIENIARKIFGVPRTENQRNDETQIEGIGKGKSTSNKLFIIDINEEEKTVYSTFLQLENSSSKVSWDVNCGNMTTAIPLVLDDLGIIDKVSTDKKIKIYNTNTKKFIYCSLPKEEGVSKVCNIPGIHNSYPEVDIFFKNPEASLTSSLFPTGNKTDKIKDINVTCIDAVVPMVIIKSEDLGLSGKESKLDLYQKKEIISYIDEIRVLAGEKMGIKNKSGVKMTAIDLKKSITLPKVALISKGDDVSDISIIYLTPKEIHNSVAVSGGACLSYACYIGGNIASELYKGDSTRIKNFSGVSDFGVQKTPGGIELYTKRNAQIYMKGEFYLYDD